MAGLARGFGCAAERVETPEALAAALRSAFTTPGPVLLDIVVEDPGLFAL